MALVFKEDVVNAKPSSDIPSPDTFESARAARSTARAPLFVRIVLILVACVIFAATLATMVNIHAAGTYNQASQSLGSNLKAAAKDSADLNELKASQQQNDAQFSDAQRFSYLLLPHIANSVKSNAESSRKLSSLINAALTAQNNAHGGTSSSDASGASSSSASSTPQSSLNAEQRKKVAELLKQNQELEQSNASSSASTSSATPSHSSSSTTKAW